jgi:hypothetical protein
MIHGREWNLFIISLLSSTKLQACNPFNKITQQSVSELGTRKWQFNKRNEPKKAENQENRMMNEIKSEEINDDTHLSYQNSVKVS